VTATLDFIDRANRDKKPFFVWTNSSRMHIWTHLKKASEGKTGLGVYATAWSSMTARSASS